MNRNLKRILLDVKEMIDDPLEHIHYAHDEQNAMKGYACIRGPPDTPYAYGYYFFEFEFPTNYPFSPPTLKFLNYDGVTRFNPNLYINGKVCLSILNTWDGEKWSACQSIRTILLTLVTLLNEEPLLNEPGISREHPQFAQYHTLIEYKNVEISILKYLQNLLQIPVIIVTTKMKQKQMVLIELIILKIIQRKIVSPAVGSAIV